MGRSQLRLSCPAWGEEEENEAALVPQCEKWGVPGICQFWEAPLAGEGGVCPRPGEPAPIGGGEPPALSRSFTTSTKEAQSRPFSLLPPEPCDRPWENPDSCPRPT